MCCVFTAAGPENGERCDMSERVKNGTIRIAVIGLGYVGLPLAVAFGRKFSTVGFDKKPARLEALRNGVDETGEMDAVALASAKNLTYTGNPDDLAGCDVFVVTVPTPVDPANRPDLSLLLAACETVGSVMKPGAVVVFESTVYPGCTEDDCMPVLEKRSGLVFNRDFFCGYSPERINPGDRQHTLEKIRKIVSGSTPETLELLDALYCSILENGTYRTSSIKVAEAAKVIENSQRDLNIAFVNELAKIFHLIGIDTREVLDAAATKWNFLKFTPGLVGGHCIGVDPYYLTHKAQALGYLPEVILAGRRMNDSMGKYVAERLIKCMIRKDCKVFGAKVLQLGITFKENCTDIRNSHAADVAAELQDFGCSVDIYDPWANPADVQQNYVLRSSRTMPDGAYDAVVLAVAHKEFECLDFAAWQKAGTILFDVKGVIPPEYTDGRL